MELKVKLIIIFICILTTGCTTNTNKNHDFSKNEIIDTFDIGHRDQSKLGNGYYALLEESQTNWIVSKVTDKPIIGRVNGKQEVLFIDKTFSYIQPYYESVGWKPGGVFDCSPLLDKEEKYTACNSQFTSVDVGGSIAKNAVSAVITLGLASGSRKVIDKHKISGVVEEVNLLEVVKNESVRIETEKKLARYRNTFEMAQSVRDFDSFIANYEKFDPDKLIPLAIEKRKSAQINKDLEQKRIIAQKVEKALEESKKKVAEKQRHLQLAARIKEFRNGVKVETETNCGPVLEIKGSLLKIYFPVKDYGNEHWIHKRKIFPTGFNCQFINGSYIPPVI